MKFYSVPFLALMALGCGSSQKTLPGSDIASVNARMYAKSITEEELKTHLYTYASDDFEGRETGTEGQKKAVEYLKARYTEMDISAAKANGDYFQTVPLEISKLPKGKLSINDTEYVIGEHILTFNALTEEYTDIVFAGYGIETEGYSDYTALDVSGKLVLVKAGEPQDANGNYVLSGGTTPSVWSNMSESLGKRMEIAEAQGAKGIIYYDEANFSRFKRRFDYMKTNDSGRMRLKDQAATPFYSVFADATLAKAIFPDIDSATKGRPVAVNLDFKIESAHEQVASENVIAVIPGTELPNEYVVISSHLDHIGINADGAINNGADDDGSGTVAMLEIAQAFKMAHEKGHGPRRSLVFLHVTGEEKGLLGSEYYTDVEPIFPLEDTVANLNIDMIGRIDPKREGDRNYIYLIGSDKLSTELHELSENMNTEYAQLELDYTYNDENDPNRFYYRSDHYNFAKNNIPIIFYFNGTHDDYHRPGDTPDKINYDLLQNRSRLIFHTAWEVANRDKRLIVDKASE